MCFLCFRNLFIFYQEITSFPLKLQWFRLTSQHGEKSVCWFVSCLFCWHKTDPAGKHPDLNSCWEPSIFFFENSLSPFFRLCSLHRKREQSLHSATGMKYFECNHFSFFSKTGAIVFLSWSGIKTFQSFRKGIHEHIQPYSKRKEIEKIQAKVHFIMWPSNTNFLFSKENNEGFYNQRRDTTI